MTISWRVQQQFFTPTAVQKDELIRLPPTLLFQNEAAAPKNKAKPSPEKPRARSNLWTLEEHDRFLQGLEMFRHGPWKKIAAVVGTKTTRQTMTHAQKYRQKIERRQRIADAISSMETAAWSPVSSTSSSVDSPPAVDNYEWNSYDMNGLSGLFSAATPDAFGSLALDPDVNAVLQDFAAVGVDMEDEEHFQCVV